MTQNHARDKRSLSSEYFVENEGDGYGTYHYKLHESYTSQMNIVAKQPQA